MYVCVYIFASSLNGMIHDQKSVLCPLLFHCLSAEIIHKVMTLGTTVVYSVKFVNGNMYSLCYHNK